MSPRLIVLSVILFSLTGWQAHAADVTSTLIGSGTWTDNAVWDSALYPNNGNGGFTYDAVVNSGSADIPLGTNIVIESLTFSGGQIGGEGSLQLNAASTWSTGSLTGPAAGMGQLTLAGSGPLTLTGSTKFFNGGVTNAGTMIWQQGNLYANTPSSTFSNTGLIDLQGDGTSFTLNQPSTLINEVGGTLRRSVGTGTATIGLPVDNLGTIDVDTGVLSLNGGGSSSGVFDVAAGAFLNLAGGEFAFQDGASAIGAGTVRVTGGTTTLTGTTNLTNLEVAGGTLTVNGATQLPNLSISSGTVSGTGTLTLNAASTWSGGTLTGPAAGMGQLTLAGSGPLTLTGSTKFFNGGVTNAGTMIWQQGNLYANTPSSTFSNTGLIDLQGDGTSFTLNQPSTLINEVGGTLRRSVGTGTATIGLPVDNLGTIDVDTGVLSLNGGGSSSGVFDVAAGAILDLSGGTFDLEAGASGVGAGVVRVNGATLNVNAVAQMANLEFASGQIVDSAGRLSGNLNWTGGTISDGTTLGINLTTTATGSTKFFNGAVTNAGTLVWQQGVIYTGAPDSTFNNIGLVDLQGDGSSFTQNYAGTVVNAADGTLRRSTGTGTAAITLAVDNQGTIEVDSGTLQLSGGGSSSGVFDVAAGAVLNLSGNFTLNDGATGTGAGVVQFASGMLTVNGTATMSNLELSGGVVSGGVNLTGNISWTGGTFAGVTLGDGSTITATGSTKFFDGEVTNAGTLVWQQGVIYAGSSTPTGNTFLNTGLVDLQGDGSSFTQNYAGTVVNAADGTLRRSIGTGTASITLAVDNLGTFDVDSGVLALSGGGSSSGVFDVAAGAVLDLSGNFTLNDGATGTGAGVVRFASGMLTVDGTSHVENLEWTGGTIGGNGILAGETTASGSTKFYDKITNDGTLIWQQGVIYNANPDSLFTNTGLVDLQGDGSSFTQNYAGTVVNAADGTLRRSAGTGTASITLAVDNQGTIEALSGVLNVSGGLSNLDAPTNTLTGGTYRSIDSGSGASLQVPGAAITTIAVGTTVELSGASAAMSFGGAGLSTSLINNAGTLRIYNSHNFTMTNALNNTGNIELGGTGLAGGTMTSGGNITNAASGTISGHGTINNTILNSGAVRASGGTLAVIGGVIDGQSGTVQVDTGATLNLSGASGASDGDFLIHNGADLNLGAHNFLVAMDYQNANFSVGNAFNPRANVTGAGQINASPGITQTLGGNVTAGGTATATMNFGNVHVGSSTTLNYQINNVGAGGPSLRGAVQTSVSGANLTDGRITGAGVSNNFGPIAPGANSGNRAVTFNATTAGPLTGQQVRIVNNFDNVAEQTLQIAGAAYRLAQPSLHSPEPVNFGIVHVGDVVGQAITLTNNVPNDGFSERLNASIGTPTGHATTNGGSFTGLVPGSTNNTSLAVGVNTATAGTKSGTATITLTSTGVGTSGLANTALANQTVNVQAQVNNFALPELVKVGGDGAFTMTGVNEFTLNFGTVLEGSGVLTAELGVINDVAAPADDLAGTFTITAPGYSATGFNPFVGIAAGSLLDELFVGLDSSNLGAFAGLITLAPRSTNANPFTMDLAPVTIHLAGFVRRPGDFDGDLDVDGRDFLSWQRGGSPNPLSSADLAEWQTNYGTPALVAIATSNQSVPEPNAMVLCLLASVPLELLRRW